MVVGLIQYFYFGSFLEMKGCMFFKSNFDRKIIFKNECKSLFQLDLPHTIIVIHRFQVKNKWALSCIQPCETETSPG